MSHAHPAYSNVYCLYEAISLSAAVASDYSRSSKHVIAAFGIFIKNSEEQTATCLFPHFSFREKYISVNDAIPHKFVQNH